MAERQHSIGKEKAIELCESNAEKRVIVVTNGEQA